MERVRQVVRVTEGQEVVDGAGVRIHRIIGAGDINHIDPFVLLDEIKSTDPDDYIAGFPTHPHRGIETITYMKSGKFRHKDSRGNGGLLTEGCVQWMTAGRGILHSEMPESANGLLWGYQLWLSLPAKLKMTEPGYQHISPEMTPVVEGEGVSVKLISGRYAGDLGPARNLLEADYFEVALKKDTVFNFTLDEKMNSFIYLGSGSVTVDPEGAARKVRERELAELAEGTRVVIRGDEPESTFLFLASYPNNEPIVRGGPFVMNTEEEIRQAFADYRSGKLG